MGHDTPTAVAAPSTPDAPRISARVPDLSTGESGGEVRAVKMPLVDRVASAVVTGAPPILVLLGMWLGWNHGLLVWQDLLVLAIFYMVIGSGITVGFHRLLTHRSFKTHRFTRAFFAALGSAAAEGPVIDWVATHRKHHQYSDESGDPHSPHLRPRRRMAGPGLGPRPRPHRLGVLRHGGRRRDAATPRTCSPTRGSASWTAPSCCGWWSGWPPPSGSAWPSPAPSPAGSPRCCGAARRASSSCTTPRSASTRSATTSARPTSTPATSHKNVFWLAIPTWGEAWHNNHHAFPTSYRHGLSRWQLDPSAAIIRTLEMAGLAWDVVRVDPARRERKLAVQQG